MSATSSYPMLSALLNTLRKRYPCLLLCRNALSGLDKLNPYETVRKHSRRWATKCFNLLGEPQGSEKELASDHCTVRTVFSKKVKLELCNKEGSNLGNQWKRGKPFQIKKQKREEREKH